MCMQIIPTSLKYRFYELRFSTHVYLLFLNTTKGLSVHTLQKATVAIAIATVSYIHVVLIISIYLYMENYKRLTPQRPIFNMHGF